MATSHRSPGRNILSQINMIQIFPKEWLPETRNSPATHHPPHRHCPDSSGSWNFNSCRSMSATLESCPLTKLVAICSLLTPNRHAIVCSRGLSDEGDNQPAERAKPKKRAIGLWFLTNQHDSACIPTTGCDLRITSSTAWTSPSRKSSCFPLVVQLKAPIRINLSHE